MLEDPISKLSEKDLILFQRYEEKRGKLQYLYRYLFHHPALIEKVESLGSFLRFEGILPKEIVSFIAALIAKRFSSSSVFKTHIEKLSKELKGQIEKNAPIEISPFKEIEILLDQYLKKEVISDEIASVVIENFGIKGYLELVMLCSFYQMLIYANAALGLDP